MNHVILDLEVYPNYFLAGWGDLDTGKYAAYTQDNLEHVSKIILREMPYFITFNGQHYDLRILSYALANFKSPTILQELKAFSDAIIVPETVDERLREIFQNYRWWNHPNLDLKEVLGGRICPSLKKLACRLHLPQVESLPVHPDTELTTEQQRRIIEYNKIDILNTKRLLTHCEPLLELRRSLSGIYKIDCRSLSDAQIAERVVSSQMKATSGDKFDDSYPRPTDSIVYDFHYDTLQLKQFYRRLQATWIQFEKGYDPIKKKQTFKKFFLEGDEKLTTLPIPDIMPPCEFKFGGLHSVHKRAIRGDSAYDVDVASFYPNLILKFNIYPEGVGEGFLKLYRSILERRLAAKKAGNKIEAESLKIVLNSVFGKFNEFYSKLHDPVSGAAVCLNGECAILRLMDLCFQNNIEVLLVNTDGIVTRTDPEKVVVQWQDEIGMILETKPITKFVIKDSNNHILKYASGEVKIKGIAFAYEPSISKQSNFPIIHKAVCEYLLNDVPVEETVKGCKDLYQFVGVYSKGPSILEVKGAASVEEPGQPLSGIVRYYLSDSGLNLFRRNVKGWTRIADSEGYRSCNDIPVVFPTDICYDSYMMKATKKLEKLL